jgi:hypothetical protein
MCHYIINTKLNNKKNDCKLATIHDCFFIQPEKLINYIYRKALLFSYTVHDYNLICWILDIINSSILTDPDKLLVDSLEKAKKQFESFSFSFSFSEENTFTEIALLSTDDFIKLLESFADKCKVSGDKAKWAIIIEYLKQRKTIKLECFYKEFQESDLNSLFIDNE